MNAQELFGASGKPAGIFYCEVCRTVHPKRIDADKCCVPNKCACGTECPKHWLTCDACRALRVAERDRQAWESAKKRTKLCNYTYGWVYVDGDEAPITVDELLDRMDEDLAWSEYVYGCYESVPSIDADRVIEDALESANAYDGAEERITAKARAELATFVQEWSIKHMPTLICQDTEHAIILPQRYDLYCVDRGDKHGTENQYLGPFASHDEAQEQAKNGDAIRRCRQLSATEIDGIAFKEAWTDDEDGQLLDRIVVDIDELATSGNLPDGAWHCIGEQVVFAQVDTLPTAETFDHWLVDNITIEAYICEGDE